MNLTIVIPVFNHWKTTAQCIASILKNEIPIPYKILIVNDASTDLTSTLLKNVQKEGKIWCSYLSLEVIRNEKNLGYILSTNIGLKNSNSDYILLLNNDVILQENCIRELLKASQEYPNIGLLGALQLDENKNLVPLKTFLRGEKATIRDHIVSKELPKDLNTPFDNDIVMVACVLIPRTTLEKVGYFDEQFQLGCYEQEDYCLRMKEAGLRVAFCPMAKFIHIGSVSTMGLQEYSIALDKNRELFHKKWGKKLTEGII